MSQIIKARHPPARKDIEVLLSSPTDTPSFIYREPTLTAAIALFTRKINCSEVKVLYSLKPFAFADALRLVAQGVDGFSVSSLFEAKLARDILQPNAIVQFVSPGIRQEQLPELTALCDRLTVNSLSQWRRFRRLETSGVEWGIRINPNLSFTDDSRYDPCRPHSKLGVLIEDLIRVMRTEPKLFEGLNGIHFHNNCVSTDWANLLETVRHIEWSLPGLLTKLDWINFGGGYDFSESTDFDALNIAIDLLRSKYDLDIIIEPGAGFVNSACYIISSVIDIFESDGKTIAVLDTTVNHMPEIFEYQFEPDILGEVESGTYEYILAGCSCLAGDVFGEYAFEDPLEIGQRVAFQNVGAYSLVKAHMFNGINLPSIYSMTPSGELILKKQFTYEDFASRCGVKEHATARARA